MAGSSLPHGGGAGAGLRLYETVAAEAELVLGSGLCGGGVLGVAAAFLRGLRGRYPPGLHGGDAGLCGAVGAKFRRVPETPVFWLLGYDWEILGDIVVTFCIIL